MVIKEKRSQSASVAAAAPSVPSLRAERKFSLQEANASNKLLTALEDGNVDDVRRLVSKFPEGVTSALNTPSLLAKHKLRTPIMAAARSGDFAKFSTVLDAFDRQFENKLARDFEMRLQLANRDRDGMTAAMLAARSGSVPIVAELMTEIEDTESFRSLEARDHRHMTLLMHAASVGPAPVFYEVQEAIISSVRDYQDFALQLELRSSDDKNVLMHAASSGDAMLLKTVADACRTAMPPHKVREILVGRDSDGLNLLMHAASCQTTATASLPALIEVEGEAEDTPQGDGHEEGGTGEDGTEKKGDKKIQAGIKTKTKQLKHAHDAGRVAAAAIPPVTAPPGTPPLGGPAGTTTTATATTTTTADAAIAVAAAGGATVPLATTGGVEAEAEAAAEAKAKAEALARPPVVPVFKIAFKLVTECLWKDKVLEQLKATDLWGRNVLTHALLSGHKLMFEAVLGAVRDVVSDEEVSEMLETNEGEREDEPMIEALDMGQTNMRKLFALRVAQIKKDVDARSKLSSIDAKIESFIPGKLVVIFQLLLPQIAIRNQLYLLYILCALAPVLKLATSVAKKTGASSKRAMVVARTGKLSIFLGAPAMFFWGIGTSDIGTTSVLNWSPALSATAMAVATICIPAVDAFFYSSSAARWGDKISCMEWRFHYKAYQRWFRVRDETTHLRIPAKKRVQEVLPSYSTYSTFGGNPASDLEGVEEGKREPAPITPVAGGGGASVVSPDNGRRIQA